MKQKTRFKNFGNIGISYRSIIGRHISISPKKTYRSISNCNAHNGGWFAPCGKFMATHGNSSFCTSKISSGSVI